MIERLIYTSEAGASVELSARSTFAVNIAKDARGLSDVSSAIYTTSSMGQDGDALVGVRLERREIRVSGFIKARDAMQRLMLRRSMLKVLNPHLSGVLRYILGDQIREIPARVVDAPVFRKKSVYESFDIEFVCLSPFWRDPYRHRTDIALWKGAMSFPLELSSAWEIGYREPSLIVGVTNAGDVSTGLVVQFEALGALTNPSLRDVKTQEFIRINAELEAGDIVTVSTGFGQKRVELMRGGVVSNFYRYLDDGSSFIQLPPGESRFRYAADTGQDALEVRIYHTNQYLGV